MIAPVNEMFARFGNMPPTATNTTNKTRQIRETFFCENKFFISLPSNVKVYQPLHYKFISATSQTTPTKKAWRYTRLIQDKIFTPGLFRCHVWRAQRQPDQVQRSRAPRKERPRVGQQPNEIKLNYSKDYKYKIKPREYQGVQEHIPKNHPFVV